MGPWKHGVLPAGLFFVLLANSPEDHHVSIGDCTFASRPEEFRSRESRARREIHSRTMQMTALLSAASPAAAPIARRNFVDDAIFGKLEAAGVQPAALTTDEEFFRRISLDLTGRAPLPDEIRAFLEDSSPGKRNDAIERLLYSEAFGHRWTMWMGDLVQLTAAASNVNLQIDGRNAYYVWLRNAVLSRKSFKDTAYELVSGMGNNYDHATGAANYAVRGRTPMGPAQDTYDTMLARTAAAFLGIAYYDCLLCHDGRRHLDQISLWGGSMTRLEAEQMAAFFARQRLTPRRVERGEFYYNSFDVSEAAAGGYDLNTNFGNRPTRAPVGTLRSLTPQYRTGEKPLNGLNWRESFAHHMSQDRLFSINAVNRMWKYLFGLGLVDPVDTLDPARLDPANPPPAPWTLQATHPELLVKLADQFVALNYDVRAFLMLLLQSSAYQLSSRYSGEWKYEYTPLFARHYPRRLEGEEIHDVLVNASGVAVSYTLQGLEPAQWAVALPEPAEPRSNRASLLFMNAFFRGNRDTQPRTQSGSILQEMYLMNDPFALNRIRVAAPRLQNAAKLGNGAAVEEVYLLFLSRRPTESERGKALVLLNRAPNAAARNAALEDLAWVCLNKVEFLFSY
jgi:hypothetical protein